MISQAEAPPRGPIRSGQIIARQAVSNPGNLAILGCGAPPLSYRGLLDQVDATARCLNGAGVGLGDRVAVVLPSGPEMATCFLSVASASSCAPLNPAYRAEEFEFYLDDLRARALILPRGEASAARRVAERRGIRIFELVRRPGGPAGTFTLETGVGSAGGGRFAEADDVALLLHTSGTTSRPKLVPLTHRNLTASARQIQMTLELTGADRCLSVMPLFHIHGLIGATLSSIAAGGSVVCTPGFQAPKFLGWLEEFQPTWYTAVPTMHQSILARAILARARVQARAVSGGRLRFIRSSSAPLPPQVMAELERVCGAPVIESYGMTEASHQIASNPLPPAVRKLRSVGRPAGPEIAVMNARGNLLPHGATGEVVIRGQSVTAGYGDNPAANREAFCDGWFRTGDEGYFDADGYLFLTGRLKEIINRGGEKISPREVDEVLLDHPAVAQTVTFALPDEKLGEDVGAAVVLRDGATVGELELKEFAAARLADFKVPRRIVILDEIPRGATGKLQRIGLAQKLGLDSVKADAAPASPRAPETAAEEELGRLYGEVLGVDNVGLGDNFFDLGGDSILATQLLSRMRERWGVEISMARFFESPTVSAMAEHVERAGKAVAETIGPLPR